MPVLSLNDKKIEKYNEFVRKSPYARAPQDTVWEHVKKGWKGKYVYLEKGGNIVAALSILSVNSADGKNLFYANRGPVCDFYNIDMVCELIDEAKLAIKNENPFLLRIDPEVKYDEDLLQKYRDKGFVFRSRETDIHSFIQPRFNMIMNIKGKKEEDVFESIHPKTKYNIRLSERKGIKTRFVKKDDNDFSFAIDKFFELTQIMAKRQGVTHRPKDYFVRMFESYPNSRLYLSSHENDVLSAAISWPYNKKLFYIYGASSNEKRNLMPNYNMQWEMIKWGIELGMDEYDFGGVFNFEDSDGLYRFKNGFCKVEGFTEFIGELDLVFDEKAYNIFNSK